MIFEGHVDDQLAELAKTLMAAGRTMIEDGLQHAPAFFAVRGSQVYATALFNPGPDGEDKEEAYARMACYAGVTNADAVIYLSDSWYRTAPIKDRGIPVDDLAKDDDGNVRLREDPLAEEALMCQLLMPDGLSLLCQPYRRDDHGKVVWDEPLDLMKDVPDDTEMGGAVNHYFGPMMSREKRDDAMGARIELVREVGRQLGITEDEIQEKIDKTAAQVYLCHTPFVAVTASGLTEEDLPPGYRAGPVDDVPE